MKLFFTDTFSFPLPAGHRFPADKYQRLRRRITRESTSQDVELRVPEPAPMQALLRAHDPDYVRRLFAGELSDREIRRVGLPWSPQILQRTRYSIGGTIAACRAARMEGVGVNLGGGTHHAFRDRGQGFCWLNDCVIAARALQAEGQAATILIIDCDVHQGNGSAAMTQGDPTIFTFSIHGKNNFPYRKETSDLDIELADGTDDDTYLQALGKGLQQTVGRCRADLAIYLAGADPYRKDRYGRLGLTKAGLAERDRRVFAHLKRQRLPVAVTMGGGYAPDVEDIVDIHFQTIQAVLAG